MSKFNNHHKKTWKEFGKRYWAPSFTCVWPGEGVGRFWKKKLSKARRAQAKLELRGIKAKPTTGIEREVNWRTW